VTMIRSIRLLPLLALCAIGASCTEEAANGDEASERAPAEPTSAPAVDLTIALGDEPVATRTTASGVEIESFAPGEGEPVAMGDTVRIVFRAMLADGTEFRSSEALGTPLNFELTEGRAVPGLLEGLVGMRPGAERRIRVPWRMGYGEYGRSPVPPKTDLVFEVRMLSIEKK